MIVYSKSSRHGFYPMIKPRNVKLPKSHGFQHPKDLKVILAYLMSRGSLYCTYGMVERLYQDFSKEHGRYWLPAISFKLKLKRGENDPVLYEFSDWMDDRMVDDEFTIAPVSETPEFKIPPRITSA